MKELALTCVAILEMLPREKNTRIITEIISLQLSDLSIIVATTGIPVSTQFHI